MKHTKEQLEGMSDFQLSSEVLKLHKRYDGSKIGENESRTKASFKIEWVTYCFDVNDPSDMIPLVFEAGMSLINFSDGYAATGKWDYIDVNNSHDSAEWWCGDLESTHSNPLRACAIVWLLMQGGE